MAENLGIKRSPVGSVLECPLCLHQMKLPQTLQQCLHSYCKSCLDKVPQKSQDGRQGWLCPMCDNFTKCDQVEQNTFIEELQKIHSEPEHGDDIKCEQCSDDCGAATWKCDDCKIGLCESAKSAHLRIPMLKSHKVVPLNKEGEKFIDSIVFCKVHDDVPLQINCCDCDQLICYRCSTTDHKSHTVETVEEALERILPEAESSARQVDENIDIMEAQIQGVKKEIEQTRDTYASCRMHMDDHLEKVICRMKAMKAKMEEDINEQESIALDTFNELKQQLEKQLSQARIISNLTSVVTTKTRHISQLQQLQTGLIEKVKAAGLVKNQRLSFNLPATNFIEGERFTNEISHVLGKLGFHTNEQIVSILGESYTKPNRFLCPDFNQLTKTQYQKEKEIVVDASWCNRLSYIDNKIWLPLDSRKKINIYNDDGELIDVIDTGGKAITVIKMTFNGDVICAGKSGLFVTDTELSKWTVLSKGEFSDVVVDKDQLTALRYDCPSVHIYSKVKTDHNLQGNSWCERDSFVLNEYAMVNSNSIICIVDEEYLFISTLSWTEAKGLYQFTFEGKFLGSCQRFNPVICGSDQNNHILVTDFIKGSMYLLKPYSDNDIQETAILSTAVMPQTRSVVIDRKYNCWILTGDKDFKLIKFTAKQ